MIPNKNMHFGANLFAKRECTRITESTASRHEQNKAIEGKFFEQTVALPPVKCPNLSFSMNAD